MDDIAFLPNGEIHSDKAEYIRIQELEAHSSSQAATIRTLKSLLDQSREECEQLKIGVTVVPDTASSDQTGIQRPSTAPKSFGPAMQRAALPSEHERKVKYLELINVKLAKEIENYQGAVEQGNASLRAVKLKIRKLMHEKDKLGITIRELLDELHKSKESLDAERQRVNELSKSVKAFQEENVTLKDGIATSISRTVAEAQVGRIESLLQSALLEKDQLEEKCDFQEGTIQQLSQEILSYQATLKASGDELESAVSLRCKLEGEVRDAAVRIATVQKALTHKESTIQNETRALEASHALSISLLEQTHESHMAQFELDSKVMRESVSILEERSQALMSENTKLKSQLLQLRMIAHTRVDAEAQVCPSSSNRSVSTEWTKNATASTETEKSIILSANSITDCLKYIRCEQCSPGKFRVVATLFPCGHGVCEDCLLRMLDADTVLSGICCKACNNSLPVSYICRNRYLSKLSDLFYKIEYLSG